MLDVRSLCAWHSDSADIAREEGKRERSPASFFYSQGQALVLAAEYFKAKRLAKRASSGVAYKHLHRIHLALFGQMMASFEYLLKDFIARVFDAVPTFDERIRDEKWVTVNAERVLAVRAAPISPGALLFHSTLGWHEPEEVNKRYKRLFEGEPIATSEFAALEPLWVLRHSVAHNAGFVTSVDAARGRIPLVSAKVADISAQHIADTFESLCPIARRLAEVVGAKVIQKWISSRTAAGPDYLRDKETYKRLKLLATYVCSRARPLPKITKSMYTSDYKKATAAPRTN